MERIHLFFQKATDNANAASEYGTTGEANTNIDLLTDLVKARECRTQCGHCV